MKIKGFFHSSHRPQCSAAARLLVFLAVAVILWPQNATGQHPAVQKLTLAQVEQLVSSKVPDSTLSAQIQGRGLSFAPTPAIVESLRAKGAGPQTLAAIEAHISKSAPSNQHGAPKPIDSGSSLAETMRFIQDKLNGLGRVSYTIKDTTPRKTQIQTVILEYRDVVVDPNQCRISIHVKATSQITNKDITHSVPGEWNIRSQDLVYSLRSDVQDIEVKPLVSQDDKIESISQPITSLVLHLRQGGVDSLAFTDAALANRVGFAMRHAIELCGGHHVTNSGMSASVNANVPRRVSISADVMGDMLIANTTPVYPPIAKAARISGTVVLQATISNTGSVENLRVISGPAMLQQASLDAVKTWRYRPYLINGEPVEVETTVNVIFTLGG